MAPAKHTTLSGDEQTPPTRFEELADVLSHLEDAPVLKKLWSYRLTGRPGYPLRAMWRAYVCSFLLNLSSTNALIRELEDRPDFRIFCGFADGLPHRTTFNRFIQRLAEHTDLVEASLAGVTDKVRGFLPDFGTDVAIDSTTVRSHSNPNRKRISDPEASWTAKNSAKAKDKDGKEWHWGYKVHMVADANYGLPIAQITTTARRNDSPYLPKVITHAQRSHPWFKPQAVIADRGYDSMENHEHLHEKGMYPIIHTCKHPEKSNKNGWIDGIYTTDGEPTCIGQVPMKYVKTDPVSGHRLYRCAGCHMRDKQTLLGRYCQDEVWEDPMSNIKLFGAVIRRGSRAWKAYYEKRQAIERVFKSMKESRRLERHFVRGLRKVTLHAIMSTITYQATALVKLLAGRAIDMRWMVRRVA